MNSIANTHAHAHKKVSPVVNRCVRILDDIVVNQIAAGEVVERPASVVKELVENSIDAGAGEITVIIENGGHSFIEVVDDGSGMSRDDALTAIERFGTSKISTAHDLTAVETLGFRGEALPSIASVSRFSLNTRLKSASKPASESEILGTSILIEGGKLRDVVEMGLPSGTKVQVRQLFFNVPARRKFLRSERTEAGLIKSLVLDFAAAYPHLRLRLVSDGSEQLNFSPTESFAERVSALKLAGARPLKINTERVFRDGKIRISAMLSEPLEALSTSGRLRLIVNGRAVRDRLLLKAVRDGYGNFLKSGKYPVGILKLELPPEEVDVNVHPQKTEVRFRSPQFVFATIAQAIRDEFLKIRPEGSVCHMALVESSDDFRVNSSRMSQTSSYLASGSLGFDFGVREELPVRFVGSRDNLHPEPGVSANSHVNFRYVGQLLGVYLVLEGRDRMAILDMHAAHERVRFYKIKKEFLTGEVKSQLLLVPEIVDIPAELIPRFAEFSETLTSLGIEAELFGEGSVIVRGLPSVLGSVSPREIFQDIFSLSEWEDWQGVVDNRIDSIIARLACHSSIRSGRELEPEEVYALLAEMERVEASGLCPHGRPVMKEFSRLELEKLFGRVE